jgi:hypothetical protein
MDKDLKKLTIRIHKMRDEAHILKTKAKEQNDNFEVCIQVGREQALLDVILALEEILFEPSKNKIS